MSDAPLAARRFAVAFSFPGEYREYVEKVAEALLDEFGGEKGKARIFYDTWHEGEIIGYNTHRKLQEIYANDADLIVPFFCQEYENKNWCGVELRAIEHLIFKREFDRVLPFRFDMVKVPGSFDTDVFPLVIKRPPEEIARLITERYRRTTGGGAAGSVVTEDTETTSDDEDSKPGHSERPLRKRLLLAGCVIIVIALLGLGGWQFVRIAGGNKPKAIAEINGGGSPDSGGGKKTDAMPDNPEEDDDPEPTLKRVTADELLAAKNPYDPQFLSLNVPLPHITDEVSSGELLNGRVFDYIHYSLVVNERYGMPLYTACNIDRATVQNVHREMDRWFLDPRIPSDLQMGEAMYAKNDWDRGHLVARRYIIWGEKLEDARLAGLSAFFYSNAAPQHAHFNQGLWGRLESFILGELHSSATRLSIFTGPVNRPDDFPYRLGKRIPRSFWTIAVIDNPEAPRKPWVYAYIMDQYTQKTSGELEFVPRSSMSDPFEATQYQVTVKDVEALTPLEFGILRKFDTKRE